MNYLSAILATTVLFVQSMGRPQEPPQTAIGHPAANDNAAAVASTVVPIVSQTEQVNPDGSYVYSFESADGTKVESKGEIKDNPNPGPEDEDKTILVVRGSFSYNSPDGQVISIRYVADEQGFQPEGDHIPTAPATPEAVAKSLKQQEEPEEAKAAKSETQPQPHEEPQQQQTATTIII